jgi:fructose-specific phosphotransferase system IIC component
MKRKFYPDDGLSRITFWLGILNLIGFVYNTSAGNIFYSIIGGLGVFTSFVGVYVFRDQFVQPDTNSYSTVLAQVSKMGKQLSDLGLFLEQESKRVADTEDILSKLQEEKTKLEPVILSQRETVDAILAAHSKRNASNVWKERVMGFVLGLLASLLAGIIYDFFKHKV